jgi:aldehyde oxidoreductase
MLKKTLFINGIERRAVADPECTLLDFLQKQMFLLGVKGDHGACTIILNGKAVGACGVKMKDVPADARITTIEGVGSIGNLHPLQLSWILHKAGQCGVCTPGFIMAAKALLDEKANPSKDDVLSCFKASGNSCKTVKFG